jgi:ribonucleoside-diphosphate reductase alpha chain
VSAHVPSLSTASEGFAGEVSTLLLALGIATTTRETVSGWGGDIYQIRVRNLDHTLNFDEIVGFLSARKNGLLLGLEPDRSGYKRDKVFLPRPVWDELIPAGHELRDAATLSLRSSGGVSRFIARRIFEQTLDTRLGQALGYVFEAVESNEDGGVQPTYDLSVPDNVTYVAAGSSATTPSVS